VSVTSTRPSVGDRVWHRVPLTLRRHWWFRREHHRWLPLHRPTTFAEKMSWRIVYDRRRLLDRTCDKLAMKDAARARCADLPIRVPETYWTGTDVAELAGVELPQHWVLKANHRCKVVAFGSGTPDVARLREQTRGWLDERNWSILGEWAYRMARRAIVAEELIGRPGEPPTEYLVFVFDGVPQLVQVLDGGFDVVTQRSYTVAWEPFAYMRRLPLGPVRPAPSELPLLLAVAARLGQGFDFIRVDLYVAAGEVWFGELTPYSHGGNVPGPPEFDKLIGSFWQLPERTEVAARS
jgi:hypothetical protein